MSRGMSSGVLMDLNGAFAMQSVNTVMPMMDNAYNAFHALKPVYVWSLSHQQNYAC